MIQVNQGIKDYPRICEKMLETLQEECHFNLTPEQFVIAKLSSLELADRDIPSVRKFIKMWEETPGLSDFAAALKRKYIHSQDSTNKRIYQSIACTVACIAVISLPVNSIGSEFGAFKEFSTETVIAIISIGLLSGYIGFRHGE